MVGPTNPALAVHLVAAATEEVFCGQAVHVLAPVTAAYVPAAQFTQVAAKVAPKTEEYMPAAHFTHVAEEVAPKAVE